MSKLRMIPVIVLTIVAMIACQNQGDLSRDRADGTGGFLWHVEHGDTDVYLQGTIHIGEEDFYPLNTNSEDAYEEADVILPEIDLNNIDEQEIQMLTMELAMYEDGTTLEDHVPAELYAEIGEMLESFGANIRMVENVQPWFIEILMTEMYTQQAGYDFQYGVDQYFLDRALEDEKEINDKRNVDMAEQIVEILENDSGQTYFVIVGAMHMVAEPSIVSILEENGFDVEHVY